MSSFYHMLNKFKSLLMFPVLFTTSVTSPPANESIEIKGYVEMVEIGQQVPIYLQIVEGHPFAYLDVDFYVDNVLEKHYLAITATLDEKPFFINGFTNENEKKHIKIVVNYVDKGLDDSVCEFNYYSPSFNTLHVFGPDNSAYQERNVSRVDFTMKGKKSNVKLIKEAIFINGIRNIEISNKRFINLSNFEILSQNLDLNVTNCEFRLYHKFENSDFLYKENYTSIDLSLTKISQNYFRVDNEYKYYVSNENGGIYENYIDGCDEDLLPFFIPYGILEDEIEYEIVFTDLGKNHNTLVYPGKIKLSNIEENDGFGTMFNFKYSLIDNPLEGVSYG